MGGSRTLDYVYHLPWEIVVRAYVSRYPLHPRIPMMLAADIMSVDWNPDTGKLVVDRRMKADLEAPYWLKRVFGVYWMYMWQTTTLSMKEKKLVSVSHSNPASTLYKAGEVATWEVHPENPNWTLFTVTGTLELEKFFWNFQSIIESLLLRTYNTQFALARKIDHEFIDQLTKLDEDNNELYTHLRSDNVNTTSASASASASATPTVSVALDPRIEQVQQRHTELVILALQGWIERSYAKQKHTAAVDFRASFHHDVPVGPCEGKML
ncbi:SEC14 protein 1 [Pelomyxa schiedti]|nr:SEC14 protein 1 [Pelomyxa schiedti]